jgi:uncharacterized protein
MVRTGKKFRILSISGGGIRGLVPSLILVRLEQITGKHITELFDLIIGTSTGAMITAVLTTPSPPPQTPALTDAENGQEMNVEQRRWKYTAKDLLDVYIKEGAITFESSMWKKMTTINGIYGPMYYTKNRDERFKAWLGDLRLKDSLSDVVLTSYDLCLKEPVFFKSRKARLNPEEDDVAVIDCIKAATAAPTVWPPHPIGKKLYIDALYGKNPALFGVIEALKHYDCSPQDMLLLSLGTGYIRKHEEANKIVTTGPAFLMEVFNSTVNANTMSTTYMIQQLLQTQGSFLDLDFPLPEEHMGICDVSKANINYLIKATEDYLTEKDEEIHAFARQLMQEQSEVSSPDPTDELKPDISCSA